MRKIPSATETDGGAVASSIPMPQSGEFSLYIHIPFCTKKCDYCHFYVIPDQLRFKELYKTALSQEWEWRKSLLPSGSPLSVYFGGGTPSLLGAETIGEILSWISPDASCEVTLEANPDKLSLEQLRAFKEAGINRLSLGAQSFDDTLLNTLSRTHSAQTSLDAVEAACRAGFDNLSIDLMYDVPHQSLQSWCTTLTRAIQLPISHLSLYNLTLEPHTVFYKKRSLLPLPDSETSFEMLTTALETFEKGGFERYEISAFARNGKRSKHNSGYWTNRPFLGFGPSAFSYWNQCRFRNVANLNRYAKCLQLGEDPVDFKETLSEKERLKESLAIGLRLIQGVPLQVWPEEIEKKIAYLQSLHLVEKTENHLRLTSQGLLFHDTVAEEIMSS